MKRKTRRKKTRNAPKNFETLFSCLKVFHRHFFTVLHPQFQTQFQIFFFTTRIFRHGHAECLIRVANRKSLTIGGSVKKQVEQGSSQNSHDSDLRLNLISQRFWTVFAIWKTPRFQVTSSLRFVTLSTCLPTKNSHQYQNVRAQSCLRNYTL